MTATSLTNPANATTSPNAASTSSAAAASTNTLANEQVFLQLLVAQLKYQDPQSPADGTQFVTQLAQFADLEQVTQSRSDLDAIKQQLSGSDSSSSSTNSSTNGIS